jgi:hypothetical protein
MNKRNGGKGPVKTVLHEELRMVAVVALIVFSMWIYGG